MNGFVPNSAPTDVVIGQYSIVREDSKTDESTLAYDNEEAVVDTLMSPTEDKSVYEAYDLIGEDDVAEWQTTFNYNSATGMLMAEAYPFEYADEDFEYDSYEYHGYYEFYVNYGENSIQIASSYLAEYSSPTPSFDLRSNLSELYMTDISFKEYVDNGGKVTVSINVYTMQDWTFNLVAVSNEYECDFTGWSEKSSIPAPSKIYKVDDEYIIDGVKGATKYYYSTVDYFSYTYDCSFYGYDVSEVIICSIDEDGVPGEFATITPIELSEKYDANVSYSKKTGLYGLDDADVELPSESFMPGEYTITVSNGSVKSRYYAEKASDARYYIPKTTLMLGIVDKSIRYSGNSDIYDCVAKYEGKDQIFRISGCKEAYFFGDTSYYIYYNVAVAYSEYQDDEPYITYDGVDFDDSIPAPTNLRRSGVNSNIITWDNASDDRIGYYVITKTVDKKGNTVVDAFTLGRNKLKINNEYTTISIYAINSNGDLSKTCLTGTIDASYEDNDPDKDYIEGPATWKSNIAFDEDTDVVLFDGYPVTDEMIEMYPNYFESYTLCSPTERWLGFSHNVEGVQEIDLTEIFNSSYYSKTPFYGKNEVKALQHYGTACSALGLYPMSEDRTVISYYGPNSVGKIKAPENVKYTLSGFESYLEYFDPYYLDQEVVCFDDIDGAESYIFKIVTKYGVEYIGSKSPSIAFYSYYGDFEVSMAYFDAEGNVSALSEPISLSYDPDVLVGASKVTSAVVNDNSLSVKWTAAKNAYGYIVMIDSMSENSHYYYLDGTITSQTIKDLAPGTYTVKVAACDKLGSFSGSIYYYDDTTFVIEGEKVLEPVTPEILVEAGDGKAVITWQAVEDAESYRVFSVINGRYKLLGEIKETVYTAEGLTNGQETGFLVLSKVNSKWSTYTNSDIVYVTPKSAKSDKPVVTAEPTYGGAKVTWGEVEGAVNYRVYTFVPGGKIRQFGSDTTETSMTVKGLKGGEKTGIIVLAQYANGKWTKYTEDDIVYVVPLDAVKPYLCVNPKGNGSYYLIWSSVPTSVRYKVMAREKGTDNWELIGATRSRCRITVELDPNKEYEFLVRGLNAKNKYTPMDADDIVSG